MADRNVFPTVRHARRAGFTLAEVLISLGIFAIGMIAVAALFPVGAILQKETADDILGRQATTNARATIEAIGLTYAVGDGTTDIGSYHTNTSSGNNVVQPVGQDFASSPFGAVTPTSFFDRYNFLERSYPTTEADPDARDYYWFFLVRDSAGSPASPSWQGFIMIVRRDAQQGYNSATPTHPNSVIDQLSFGTPTDQGTPYITLDGKTGTWNLANPPTVVGGGVYYHPNGVGVETFVFETKP